MKKILVLVIFFISASLNAATLNPKEISVQKGEIGLILVSSSYDLALISSLPGGSDNKRYVETGKIYLSSEGMYMVRDAHGEVKDGQLNTQEIDLSQLRNKLKDPKLIASILKIISKDVPLLPASDLTDIKTYEMTCTVKFPNYGSTNELPDKSFFTVVGSQMFQGRSIHAFKAPYQYSRQDIQNQNNEWLLMKGQSTAPAFHFQATKGSMFVFVNEREYDLQIDCEIN